ncbi:MAG: hypothetical protein ACPGVG_05370 [Mycobacterium sp.]
MPTEEFVPKEFNDRDTRVIAAAISIIDDYQEQGYTLTLRQLYYQFVARDWLANDQKEYKRLGRIVSQARLAGLIDWEAIEDRTRNLAATPHWEDPRDILKSAAHAFAIDKWEDQHNRIEVWIEKEALSGVIEGICQELDVAYFACRGYTSQSEQWRAGKRFASYSRSGQAVTVLHLGDHDPSGIDMTRDNQDRLDLFSRFGISVKRIALNRGQIEEYDPPPNPAKLTDSRAGGYVRRFGYESWELDALEPGVIVELIRDEVEALRDDDLWQSKVEEEAEITQLLEQTGERWSEIEEMLR